MRKTVINPDDKKYHTENATQIFVSRFRGIARNNAWKDMMTRKAAFSFLYVRSWQPARLHYCAHKSQCRTFRRETPSRSTRRPSLSSVFSQFATPTWRRSKIRLFVCHLPRIKGHKKWDSNLGVMYKFVCRQAPDSSSAFLFLPLSFSSAKSYRKPELRTHKVRIYSQLLRNVRWLLPRASHPGYFWICIL